MFDFILAQEFPRKVPVAQSCEEEAQTEAMTYIITSLNSDRIFTISTHLGFLSRAYHLNIIDLFCACFDQVCSCSIKVNDITIRLVAS